MKKILCFILSLLLCLSSVCTAYASSTDSDHGGTGGSLGGNHGGTGGSIDWETLEPVDHSDFDKVIGTLGFLMHPDSAVANAGLTLANLLGLDDLDDDTKTYINDNIMDNTRTDGDNYYFKSPTTSSTGGLILALQRAILLLAPQGGVTSTFTGPL